MTHESPTPQAPLPPAPPLPPLPPRRSARPAPSAKGRIVLLVTVWLMLGLQGLTSHASLADNPLVISVTGAAGGILAVQVQVLVTLLLGRLGGQTPTLLMVGTGRLLRVGRVGRVGVAVRPIPLLPLQACTTIVAGPGLRSRLLLGGLARTLVPGAMGAALLLAAPSPLRYLGLGALVLALLMLVAGAKQAGSTAWMVFRAPFADARLLGQLAADPAEVAAQRALMGGRLDEARTAVASVRADTLMGVRLRVGVAIADGRYRDALTTMTTARAERERLPESSGGELLVARAALFGVEAGEFAREEVQAVLSGALAEAALRIPRLIAASDIPATQALLEGRTAEALALARASVRKPTDLQTRAYALCTLAAAQAVTGDQPAARATLASAAALTPGLARVATVDRLITDLPLTRDRA
ncbi:hypothetical protein ABH931_001412 [Streptacidiphilus sp. MAP12-33]|uniref:hypothetical protein n=1 Tax=Streptacidiphilus sp. MAP12-33 TaxID=3156266 RepID=UPI003515619B